MADASRAWQAWAWLALGAGLSAALLLGQAWTALPALLAFADPTHITFGSDWPYAPKARSLHFANLLDQYPLGDAMRHAIHRGNAERLFPRLAR